MSRPYLHAAELTRCRPAAQSTRARVDVEHVVKELAQCLGRARGYWPARTTASAERPSVAAVLNGQRRSNERRRSRRSAKPKHQEEGQLGIVQRESANHQERQSSKRSSGGVSVSERWRRGDGSGAASRARHCGLRSVSHAADLHVSTGARDGGQRADGEQGRPPSHRARCSRRPASQDRVAGARTPSIGENRAVAAAGRRSKLN